MKKTSFIFVSLFLLLAVCLYGCTNSKESEATTPEIIIEEITNVETPVSAPMPEEATPSEEENVETEEDSSYPFWWELYDYNTDQEILAADGEFKNLTLQPGNTPDQLHITWFSKSSSRGKVIFRTEEDSLFNHLSAKATTEASISVPGYYRNSALIEGLESNTTYYYTLKNGGNESPVYKYETKDLESSAFTFTIAGDPEIGLGDPEVLASQRSIWKVILNRMKAQIPDSEFIISTGDQIADPASSVHYDHFLDNSVLYSTQLVPVVGNHDSGTGFFGDHFTLPNMSAIGHESGRDGDYWFVKGNALFMVLNNMSPQPTEVHEQFVAEAINANPDVKWRIVVSHYSPVTMVERYQGVRESVKREYHYMGEVFDIDLFIGGHDHIYTRGFFIDDDGDPLPDQEVEYEFHNPENPIFVVFNGATDALLREPDEDYPWAAVCVQNGVPQLTEVHVTNESIHLITHDADSWTSIDDFIIYKD